MDQAESVDGSRSMAIAIVVFAIMFVTTAMLYRHEAEPRHNRPHARVERVHLEYDLHALHAADPHGGSIVIEVR